MKDIEYDIDGMCRANKPMTAEEEAALMPLAQNGNQVAKDRIIMSNIRFIVKKAMKFNKIPIGLHVTDLIDEGILGECLALERYRPGRGVRFITYATPWIKKYMIEHIYDNLTLLKVPVDQIKRLEAIEAIRECRLHMKAEEDEVFSAPSLLDVAEQMLGSDEPRERRKLLVLIKAHNAFGVEEHDVIPTFDNYCDEMLNWDEIKRLLPGLGRRERDIIMRYYGIGCKPQSFEDIGVYYIITSERARQLERSTIKKMKLAAQGLPPLEEGDPAHYSGSAALSSAPNGSDTASSLNRSSREFPKTSEGEAGAESSCSKESPSFHSIYSPMEAELVQ
jgi:RNA polymerase sigma factor (sigma-70 family)